MSFCLGLLIGSVLGVLAAGLCAVAKMADVDHERRMRRTNDHDDRC